nr:glycerophosphodiester phosphodiesterase family protein [Bacteroides sp. 224]
MMSQTQVIAHRGFWDTQGSAQNSIASLLKADSINCYGCEFDVRMSSDGKLIVIHDAIHGLTSIKKNTADTLTRLKLKNGESLPLLSEYLQKGTELKTRLILELKKLSTPELETKAIEQIISLVSKMQLEPRMEYISFSLHAVKEFIRLAPQGTPIYYLNGDLSPQELKAIGCTGPDYNSKVFKKNPEWITECHSLGLKVNVWTVNSEEDMQWLIKHKVDFITTDRPLVLRNLLKNY